MFLSNAFNAWARVRFDDWTGKEIEARYGNTTAPEPPIEPEGSIPDFSEIVSGEARADPMTKYVVDGRLIGMPHAEALALFEKEEPDLGRECEEEREAYARFAKASDEFRQPLYDGRLTAEVLTYTGDKIYALERGWWSRRDAMAIVQSGQINVGTPANIGGYDDPTPSFAAIPRPREGPWGRSYSEPGDWNGAGSPSPETSCRRLFPVLPMRPVERRQRVRGAATRRCREPTARLATSSERGRGGQSGSHI